VRSEVLLKIIIMGRGRGKKERHESTPGVGLKKQSVKIAKRR
jgi:hypothetical protein